MHLVPASSGTLHELSRSTKWVSRKFKKLARRFVCCSKGQALSQQNLTKSPLSGGLGVIDFDKKCNALKASLTLELVFPKSKPKWHITGKYYLARNLGAICPEWTTAGRNSVPNALNPSTYYSAALHAIREYCNTQQDVTSITSPTTKEMYQSLSQCTDHIPPHACWRHYAPAPPDLWLLVRDPFSGNINNDLSFLILHRALKVRNLLRHWGHKQVKDECPHCKRSETLVHCFLECPLAREVWNRVSPTLASILGQPFQANPITVFLLSFPKQGHQTHRALFVIKTTLAIIWQHRNGAAFRNTPFDVNTVVLRIQKFVKTRCNLTVYPV